MNIEQRQAADALEIGISGRLDAHWSEHLDRELESAVRGGARLIRLDMAAIDYVSSAGIRVLLKYWKQLRAVGGAFAVVLPSPAVPNIINLTGMQDLLLSPAAPDRTAVKPGTAEADVRFAFHHPHPGARLSLRLIGQPEKLSREGFSIGDITALDLPRDTMALGLGAFGPDADAVRTRCGEFLAAGGAAICQPTDGATRPDDQVAAGDFVPLVQAAYALVCRGTFSRFFTFAPDRTDSPSLPLSVLTETAFSLCDAPAAAFVFIAETDGLVGATLRRPPVEAGSPDIFAFPDVRDWFSLTTERAHPKALALVAGVAAAAGDPTLSPFARPLGGTRGLTAHIHAAVLSYRVLPGGVLTLPETAADLLETQSLLSVMHLINDSRPISGIGESLFIRGAAWAGPLDIPAAGRDA